MKRRSEKSNQFFSSSCLLVAPPIWDGRRFKIVLFRPFSRSLAMRPVETMKERIGRAKVLGFMGSTIGPIWASILDIRAKVLGFLGSTIGPIWASPRVIVERKKTKQITKIKIINVIKQPLTRGEMVSHILNIKLEQN